MNKKIKPVLDFIRDASLVYLAPLASAYGVWNFLKNRYGDYSIFWDIIVTIISILLGGLVFISSLSYVYDKENK